MLKKTVLAILKKNWDEYNKGSTPIKIQINKSQINIKETQNPPPLFQTKLLSIIATVTVTYHRKFVTKYKYTQRESQCSFNIHGKTHSEIN